MSRSDQWTYAKPGAAAEYVSGAGPGNFNINTEKTSVKSWSLYSHAETMMRGEMYSDMEMLLEVDDNAKHHNSKHHPKKSSWTTAKLVVCVVLVQIMLLSVLGLDSKLNDVSHGLLESVIRIVREKLWPRQVPLRKKPIMRAANQTLVPFTFTPLPLGSIKPKGWLLDQMTIMSNGLAGHEADFLEIVKDNPWVGGSQDYSPLNEALPYWYNALVGLAYGLDDSRLKSQVLNVTSIILESQSTDGWLGTEADHVSSQLWSRFPVTLGMMQLADAEPTIRDNITTALHKFVPLVNTILDDGTSADEVWGRARYADFSIVLQWLITYNPRNDSQLIYQTMAKLESWGHNWENFYTDEQYPKQDLDTLPLSQTEPLFPFVHNVNTAQGLKTNGVNYRHNHKSSLIDTVARSINWTFTYHASSSGTIIGDERLAGLNPNRGHEFCGVVEEMYSLSYLHQLFGDAFNADMVEKLTFNAMPNMLSEDHWTHQYIALPNQPWAYPNPEAGGLWWNVGDGGTTFGVAPHYPCCAVNHPQGYPKYLQAVYALSGDNGVAHSLLSPASVNTTTSSGTAVTIDCATTYPFGTTLNYTITASAPFTFQMRVPGWFKNEPLSSTSIKPSSFDQTTRMLSIPIPAGSTSLQYTLEKSIVTTPRSNDTWSIEVGAVLYALDVGEQYTLLDSADTSNAPATGNTRYYNSTNPWNIALDMSTLKYHNGYANDTTTDPESSLPNPLWAYRAPPSYITARGCEIEWDLFHQYPAPVPLSGQRTCLGNATDVVLRPYGSLRARMTEFPSVDLGKKL